MLLLLMWCCTVLQARGVQECPTTPTRGRCRDRAHLHSALPPTCRGASCSYAHVTQHGIPHTTPRRCRRVCAAVRRRASPPAPPPKHIPLPLLPTPGSAAAQLCLNSPTDNPQHCAAVLEQLDFLAVPPFPAPPPTSSDQLVPLAPLPFKPAPPAPGACCPSYRKRYEGAVDVGAGAQADASCQMEHTADGVYDEIESNYAAPGVSGWVGASESGWAGDGASDGAHVLV